MVIGTDTDRGQGSSGKVDPARVADPERQPIGDVVRYLLLQF
jgi:hypothetical protein